MWPGGDCSEPVLTFTPISEKPVHKKHTVPRKRKERYRTKEKDQSDTEQRRITRFQAASTSTTGPTNELLEARVITLEANVTVMEGKLTVLEATVAKLGASNERLKEKLNRKRKRSRAGSLFPQFVAKHRRRSAPQIPQNIDLPEHDQHASPNSKRRKINQVTISYA